MTGTVGDKVRAWTDYLKRLHENDEHQSETYEKTLVLAEQVVEPGEGARGRWMENASKACRMDTQICKKFMKRNANANALSKGVKLKGEERPYDGIHYPISVAVDMNDGWSHVLFDCTYVRSVLTEADLRDEFQNKGYFFRVSHIVSANTMCEVKWIDEADKGKGLRDFVVEWKPVLMPTKDLRTCYIPLDYQDADGGMEGLVWGPGDDSDGTLTVVGTVANADNARQEGHSDQERQEEKEGKMGKTGKIGKKGNGGEKSKKSNKGVATRSGKREVPVRRKVTK